MTLALLANGVSVAIFFQEYSRQQSTASSSLNNSIINATKCIFCRPEEGSGFEGQGVGWQVSSHADYDATIHEHIFTWHEGCDSVYGQFAQTQISVTLYYVGKMKMVIMIPNIFSLLHIHLIQICLS